MRLRGCGAFSVCSGALSDFCEKGHSGAGALCSSLYAILHYLGSISCITERVVLFHWMDELRYSACCEVLRSLIEFDSSLLECIH